MHYKHRSDQAHLSHQNWDGVRDSDVGNKVYEFLEQRYSTHHLPMYSSRETDIRHVLGLAQVAKTMTHARKPTVAGYGARSQIAVVDRIITPILEFVEYLLRKVHLKSDMVGNASMCATTKRDDEEIDKGLPAFL